MTRVASLLLGMAIWSSAPAGELYVVVNARNPVQKLEHSQVVAMFTGRLRSFPGDGPVQAYDHAASSPTRESFYKALTGMDLARINSYWARLQFAGSVRSPDKLPDDGAIAARLGADTQGIGYLTHRPQDPALRVVFVVQ